MRVIPKTFTGFICGQYTRGHETAEGVMFYEDGKQTTLFVPYTNKDTSKLYRALKRLDANVADLVKKVVRI
jgi:hypothetical protein